MTIHLVWGLDGPLQWWQKSWSWWGGGQWRFPRHPLLGGIYRPSTTCPCKSKARQQIKCRKPWFSCWKRRGNPESSIWKEYDDKFLWDKSPYDALLKSPKNLGISRFSMCSRRKTHKGASTPSHIYAKTCVVVVILFQDVRIIANSSMLVWRRNGHTAICSLWHVFRAQEAGKHIKTPAAALLE